MKFFSAAFLFSISLSAQELSVCAAAEKSFNLKYKNLQKNYAKISQQQVIEKNKPTWVWGDNDEAVYLLHGFIGSPYEMSSLAQSLNNKSYTVINDILPGHGLNGFVANAYDYKSWQNHLQTNLNNIRKCFSKIHLVGFSTGALLIHDYVRKYNKSFYPASITLYSPFYKSHNHYADFLRSSARLVTPVVSTQHLYYITRFPDIEVAVLKPDYYLQQIPLDNAKNVTDLGQITMNSIHQTPKVINAPALIFISNNDQIADFETNFNLVNSEFSNLHLEIFQNQQVPHHLMSPTVSKVARSVKSKTIDFILKN